MSMSPHQSKQWTARIVAGFALCVTLTAMADDVTSAAPLAGAQPRAKTSASAPSSLRGRAAAASPSNAAGGAPATATSVATSSAATPLVNQAAPAVICFQTSLRCFTPTRAAPGAPSAPRANNLDLRAPELTRVFSQAELSQKLDEPEQTYDVQETVQVQGERQITPVSVGLMAIPWAIVHPTQAWRILMPVPEAK
jgi:hypothetical protein